MTGGQRVALFGPSVIPCEPLECRACGRTFAHVNGTAAHGFAHSRSTPEAVTVDILPGRYRFWYHTVAGVAR